MNNKKCHQQGQYKADKILLGINSSAHRSTNQKVTCQLKVNRAITDSTNMILDVVCTVTVVTGVFSKRTAGITRVLDNDFLHLLMDSINSYCSEGR
jgi:ribose 5-phosphate isomerase